MKMTITPPTRRAWRSVALLGGFSLLLAACSSGEQPSENPPPTAVSAAMPVRQTFHAKIATFGQVAADQRKALSLSVPHAVRVIATEVVAGQRVQRDQALLKLETDPTIRSAYLKAQSALQVAKDELARTQRLHAERLATNAQLDAARKAVSDAQAALAAQAKLGGSQAVTTLRAPIAGVVTTLSVQAGEQLNAGTTLIQFAPTAALLAQLGADPGAAADVRAGMPVLLDPVYGSQGTPPLHATVAMVGDAINPQSHLVDVIATLDGDVRLPAGTALSGTIETTPFQAWAVPRNALQSDAKGSYVLQIEHGKAHRVNVKVPAPNGSPVGVDGALDPHAPVITIGSYEVSDGDAVTTQANKAVEP
jgi:RND family efflux transporter MFP subunit